MHGLTFIAVAHSPTAARRWREEERALAASLDRHKRLVLAETKITDDERRLLRGIEQQLSQSQQKLSAKKCPECRRPFTIVNVEDVEIDCCRFCRGMWFDPGELRFFSDQSKEIPSDHLACRESRYHCPVCGARMTEFVFVNPNNLLVDRCPNGHGVYLEDRELERVFQIV